MVILENDYVYYNRIDVTLSAYYKHHKTVVYGGSVFSFCLSSRTDIRTVSGVARVIFSVHLKRRFNINDCGIITILTIICDISFSGQQPSRCIRALVGTVVRSNLIYVDVAV